MSRPDNFDLLQFAALFQRPFHKHVRALCLAVYRAGVFIDFAGKVSRADDQGGRTCGIEVVVACSADASMAHKVPRVEYDRCVDVFVNGEVEGSRRTEGMAHRNEFAKVDGDVVGGE